MGGRHTSNAAVSALSAETYGEEANKKLSKPDESAQELKLNFGDLKQILADNQKQMAETLKEGMQQKPSEGRGQIVPTASANKIVESLKKFPVEKDGWKGLEEQWTVAIPNYTRYELTAHLRDAVYFWDGLKGEQGDIAYIPYVMDVQFQQLGAVGNAFAATWAEASFIGSVSTTLYEAGGYADLSYYLLERFDSNLLEMVNRALASGALNSEDTAIMTLVGAGTGTNFAGNVTRLTGAAYFYSTNIPKALKLLMLRGKNVRPEECVLYLTPAAYGALLEELTASQIIAYAQPGIVTQGLIERIFGVKIVVGEYRPNQQRTNAATGTVDLCFLMRGRRAVALAPKRDILVETDKQVATRKLRVTASHTMGIKILDFKEIVRIWTSRVA